jgi:hypothetical protein
MFLLISIVLIVSRQILIDPGKASLKMTKGNLDRTDK